MRDGLFYNVEEIVTNFAIVIAFSFVVSQVIFKKRMLGESSSLSLPDKIKIGLLCGILGILLMWFTVSFKNTILDFRQLALILSALVGGGMVPCLLTGLIIGIMRLFGFGTINTSGIVATANIIVISLCVGIICSVGLSYWKKWLYSLIICNVLTSISFLIILGKNGLNPTVLFVLMMCSGGMFTAYLVRFLAKAKRHSLRMEKEATVDFLTGLNNHRTFDTVFNTSMKNAIEKSELLTLIIVDIDYFKKVNDIYGHPNGDSLLKQVGELLQHTSRNFDVISRIGGEEFSILLYDCPHQHALNVAERIRLAVQDHSFVLNDGEKIQITVSIGVSSLSENNHDNLIEQADVALYKAKHNGRNQVCSYI